ncbi:proton-coupled amino acid transporter-like protein CG1139 [Ischnura elegans]|uniref:proton-coupled amino acid transporter-like protein CG1139 n=1 Tax=Ischnura elegans TaxID=197161 RepID=UPI001ED89C16|nr:proton-coupled amino acid transporter-like protein CG1139 [Ischnura elegans]
MPLNPGTVSPEDTSGNRLGQPPDPPDQQSKIHGPLNNAWTSSEPGHLNVAYTPDGEGEGEVYMIGGMKGASGNAIAGKEDNGYQRQPDLYNPHDHRRLDHPTNNWETLIHMLKGSLGTGILAMPEAFHNAGYLVGIIGTIFIGFLCTYCLHVLIRCQYILCSRLRVPVLNYPDTMAEAIEIGPQWLKRFKTSSRHVVNAFLIVYQLGICCVYIVFVATNFKQIIDEYWKDVDVRIYMLMLLVPLILLNYIPNLKILAPFSSAANVMTFVGLGIVLYYLFGREVPSLSERNAVGEPSHFPLFIGTTLFALEAVGVIIALENNMETPSAFGGYSGVLNRAMLVIIALYVLLGFSGYLKYGEGALGSVTLNLPTDEVLAQVVKGMFAAAIFITYALQCYVPLEIIWKEYLVKHLQKRSPRERTLLEYAVRTAIVITTFLLAVAVPRLELFISLFGALCLSALGIIFPPLIEICILWRFEPVDPGVEGGSTEISEVAVNDVRDHGLGPYRWRLIRGLAIIIFGLFGLFVGSYTALKAIVVSLL